MRHHMQLPQRPPSFIVHFQAAVDGSPGVGDEQVDGPEFVCGPIHQPLHRRRVGGVAFHPDRAHLLSRLVGAMLVQVGDDHRRRPFFREPPGQTGPDSAGPAGYHAHPVPYFHRPKNSVRPSPRLFEKGAPATRSHQLG